MTIVHDRAGRPVVTPAEIALGIAPLVAGTAVGLATNARGLSWYRTLSKPGWTPPDGVFGPAWTVLYVLQGIAAVLVLRAPARSAEAGSGPVGDAQRRSAIGLFAAQLALNLGWSVVFFGRQRVRAALLELVVLWVALLATTVAFARVRLRAGVLLLPYLAWTTFAGVLNAAIARRNPGA